MPLQLQHPFSVSASGGISVTSDPDTQIRNRVGALIGTEPGERRGQYDFGVPTRSMLFENGPNIVATAIAETTRTKVATYEPGVIVDRVDIVPSSDGNGLTQVRLDYTRRESPLTPEGLSRNTNVAVISVGGAVTEVVRG